MSGLCKTYLTASTSNLETKSGAGMSGDSTVTELSNSKLLLELIEWK